MKTTTRKLLAIVDAAHDWSLGQTYGHGGTSYSCVDVCRICGLRRLWSSDQQNGRESRYCFEDSRGEPLTLRDVAGETCCYE